MADINNQPDSPAHAASEEDKKVPMFCTESSAYLSSITEWEILEATPGDERFNSFGNIQVKFPKADMIFKPRPSHFGPEAIFINCADEAYYRRKLQSPKLVVWVLCRGEGIAGYVKRRMYEAGWKRNVHVQFMCTNNFELIATHEGLDNIQYQGAQISPPDLVIPRVGANVDYFGLAVIRQLEKLGIPIVNNLESINISRDKLYTLQHVAAHGIMIPKTLVAKFPIDPKLIAQEFQFPIILKKASGSQGKGIMKVESAEMLEDLVDMLDQKDPLIFQEFLKNSSGRDLRVFVIGGKVVGSMMRIASKGFKANVHQGGRVKLVKLLPAVEWLVLETVKLIGLDVAGVDLLIDKTTYKICEVNSSPGFNGLEMATGVDIAGKMLDYLKVRAGVWRIGTTKTKREKLALAVPLQEDHLS